MIQYFSGYSHQHRDHFQAVEMCQVITAQLGFQLPKIVKENFSTFRPEGLRQES